MVMKNINIRFSNVVFPLAHHQTPQNQTADLQPLIPGSVFAHLSWHGEPLPISTDLRCQCCSSGFFYCLNLAQWLSCHGQGSSPAPAFDGTAWGGSDFRAGTSWRWLWGQRWGSKVLMWQLNLAMKNPRDCPVEPFFE
jgi:hypothetical protein